MEMERQSRKEQTAAFGCLLNGYKGFVSEKMFPYFYRAYHPQRTLEELYDDGEISFEGCKIYQLICQYGRMNTAEIRHAMCVTKKKGSSKIDRAIVELQKKFFISVAGSEHKINKFGQSYGWRVMSYALTDDFYKEWIEKPEINISRQEAKNYILKVCCKNNLNADMEQIAKVLFATPK